MTQTRQAIHTAVARRTTALTAATAIIGRRRTAAARALWDELDAAEQAVNIAVREHEQAVCAANPTLTQREVMTLALSA